MDTPTPKRCKFWYDSGARCKVPAAKDGYCAPHNEQIQAELLQVFGEPAPSVVLGRRPPRGSRR